MNFFDDFSSNYTNTASAYTTTEIDIDSLISLESLKDSKSELSSSLIRDTGEPLDVIAVKNHAADPIKSVDDIMKICHYLKECGRYRDYLYFVVGINSGLRCSDMLRLQFGHIIESDGKGGFRFKDTFPILEQKTKRKGVNRQVTINEAVRQAVRYYIECYNAEYKKNVELSDYLFTSLSNRGKNSAKEKPMTRKTADLIMKKIRDELGFSSNFSTHTLRKTFGYHFIRRHHYSNKALVLLQAIYGHSDMTTTLRYIGITSEEIAGAYLLNNLGLEKPEELDSQYTCCDEDVYGFGNVSVADANNNFEFYA